MTSGYDDMFGGLPSAGRLPPVHMTDVEFEAWREAKAARIELVQATAVLEVAAHLAEVHQQHLYRRDEGGFQG